MNILYLICASMGNPYVLSLGFQLLLLGCLTFALPTIQLSPVNLPLPAQNEDKLLACYSCWGRNCSTGSCMGRICVNTVGFDNATSTMLYLSGCRNETKGLQPNNHSCSLWMLPIANRSILEMSCSYCDTSDFCNGPERPLKVSTATTAAAATVAVKPMTTDLSATTALQTSSGADGMTPPMTTSMEQMTTTTRTTSPANLEVASTDVEMLSSMKFVPTLVVSTQDSTSSTILTVQQTDQITADLALPTAPAAAATSVEKSQTMPATSGVYSFAATLGSSSMAAEPSTVALITFPISWSSGKAPTTSSTEATTSPVEANTSQAASVTTMPATTATEPWAMRQKSTTNTLPMAIGSSSVSKLNLPQQQQTVGLFAAFSGLAVAVTLLALVSVGVACFACGARFERRRRNHHNGVVTLQNFGEIRKDKAAFEML